LLAVTVVAHWSLGPAVEFCFPEARIGRSDRSALINDEESHNDSHHPRPLNGFGKSL
jgi:hypothetical protein